MKTTLVKTRKQKPDFGKLGFGKYFTDHMLVMEYDAANGWGEPEIVPYDDFKINPACCSLHYGQGIFEGLKAYKNSKGEIIMFRPRDNFIRMNRSAERLCMAKLDIDVVLDALTELVKLEEEWIPTAPGTALYIRPFMFGSESFLGVHPSKKFIFSIILSPVGSYYEHGLEPPSSLSKASSPARPRAARARQSAWATTLAASSPARGLRKRVTTRCCGLTVRRRSMSRKSAR